MKPVQILLSGMKTIRRFALQLKDALFYAGRIEVIAISIFLMCLVAAQADPIETISTLESAPWTLATGDLDGDGDIEPVFGSIDNCLYSLEGNEVRKIAELGGYAVEIVCLDVDGDGADEIVCAVADFPSHVYCFEADGTFLWKQATEFCFVALAKGKTHNGDFLAALDLSGKIRVISPNGEVLHEWTEFVDKGGKEPFPLLCAIACGDLDSDGVDEVVVGGYRGNLWAVRLEDADLVWRFASHVPTGTHEAWSSKIPKPVTTGGREYYIDLQRGGMFVRNLRIKDIDGDGDVEVLAGYFRSEIKVVDHLGSEVWSKIINYDVVDHMIKYVHMDQRGIFKDSLAKSQPFFTFVTAPDGKSCWIVALQFREDILETATYFGATDVFVFDADGNQLVRDVRDASWFQIAPLDSEHVVMSTGMDESEIVSVNVASLVSGAKSRYRHKELSAPVQNWVDADMDLAKQPVLPPTPGTPETKIKVIVLYDHAMYDNYFFSHGALKHNILKLNEFFNKDRSSRLEYVFRVNLQTVPHGRPDTHYGLQTEDQVYDFMDFCEKNKIPTILWFSHISDINLSTDVFNSISDRCPNYFRGVMQVETGAMVPPYYTGVWKVLNEVLPTFAKNGHKIFFHSTGPHWSRALNVDQKYLGAAIKNYPDTIVPIIKLNGAQTAEFEIGACYSLWKAGHISHWGYTSLDHWTFTELHRMNPFKRTSTMGAVNLVALALGAEYILYYPPIIRTDRDEEGKFTRIEEVYPALSHMSVIEQLIEKNILEPISPDQSKSLSPVLFESKTLDHKRERLRHILADKYDGLFDKTVDFQQVQPNCVSTYAYGAGIVAGSFVPKTPYGILGILPEYLGTGTLEKGYKVFNTDQRVLFEDDKALTVDESVSIVKKALADSLPQFPFSTPDAFCAAQKFADHHWRLILIDPANLHQVGVKTTIKSSGNVKIRRVVDRVTGKRVRHKESSIPVVIKPGLYRIFDVYAE